MESDRDALSAHEAAAPPGGAIAEWRRHWHLPLICALATAVSVTHLNVVGVLLPAIEREYGWTRPEVSGGLIILAVMALLLSGLAGWGVDRFGSRRIGMAGVTLYCLGFAALGTVGQSIWNWWLVWVFISFGHVCTTSTVWAPAVARHFKAGRGLALAVSMCGNGVSAAVLPLLTALLLERFGWRGAFVGVAALLSVIALPTIWLFFRDPDAAPPAARAKEPAAATPRPTIRIGAAVTSTIFIRTALTCLLCTIGITAMVIHFVPMLREGGMNLRAAAVTAGGIGLAVIAGRLTTGMLLDRVHARWVGGVAFLLPAIGCAILLSQPVPALAFVAALFTGVALGAEIEIIAYATTRYFGLERFGTIFGLLIGMASFAAGLGPLIAASMYHVAGSYTLVMQGLFGVFLLSSLMMASLPAYPSTTAAQPA